MLISAAIRACCHFKTFLCSRTIEKIKKWTQLSEEEISLLTTYQKVGHQFTVKSQTKDDIKNYELF